VNPKTESARKVLGAIVRDIKEKFVVMLFCTVNTGMTRPVCLETGRGRVIEE